MTCGFLNILLYTIIAQAHWNNTNGYDIILLSIDAHLDKILGVLKISCTTLKIKPYGFANGI